MSDNCQHCNNDVIPHLEKREQCHYRNVIPDCGAQIKPPTICVIVKWRDSKFLRCTLSMAIANNLHTYWVERYDTYDPILNICADSMIGISQHGQQ